MEGKRQDIILLLRDYMNFLPGGNQEAFIPTGGGYGSESDWPLTAESLRRMDANSYVGQTYDALDKALRLLERFRPNLYPAILQIYLREEAGHRDLDKIKVLAANGSTIAQNLLKKHELAIDFLENALKDVDLYVEQPHKATGPKPGQDIKAAHDELFAIFSRYFDDGMQYRLARDNAVTKMVRPDGEEYYSRRHADRIIKARLKSHAEQ